MNEEWRDVVGYEGLYQVSSIGRVKSLFRYRDCGPKGLQPMPERMLKQSRDKGQSKYLHVSLSKGGNVKTWSVHTLVAFAFIPNPNGLPMVNHKDTNKVNNCADNLEWTTRIGNAQHAVANGRYKTGANHWMRSTPLGRGERGRFLKGIEADE